MYHCLLILTDGNIHDLRKTIDMVVACTQFPLSVIIVGIGDGDFSAMELLDGDKYDLVDGYGEKSRRDICQFVKMSEYKMNEGTPEEFIDCQRLAEDVLAEVPDQLVGYMQERGLKPDQKPQTKEETKHTEGDDDD